MFSCCIQDVVIESISAECRFLEIEKGYGNDYYSSIHISGYHNLRKIRMNEDSMNCALKLIITHNDNLKSISIRRFSCRNVQHLELTGSNNDSVILDLPRFTTLKAGYESFFYSTITLNSITCFSFLSDLPQFTTFKTGSYSFQYADSLNLISFTRLIWLIWFSSTHHNRNWIILFRKYKIPNNEESNSLNISIWSSSFNDL